VEAFATWKELTIVYHEGVPGHHLQASYAMADKAGLNRWQRKSWVSGHGEGWALYAERLMGELGYLDDPGAYLGMLDSQRLLTAQVPLDIGVHLELDVPAGAGWHEGERWTAELAWELLRAHSSWDEPQLRSELRRCLGLAGQAPSTSLASGSGCRPGRMPGHGPERPSASRAFTTVHSSLGAMGLDPLRLPGCEASRNGAGAGAAPTSNSSGAVAHLPRVAGVAAPEACRLREHAVQYPDRGDAEQPHGDHDEKHSHEKDHYRP
jgi:hypothetical protein